MVVLTTSNEERDKIDAYNLNVAGYLLKPVTFVNFDQRVRIEFRLVNTKQGWKVSNILYGGGMDFVQILSQPL